MLLPITSLYAGILGILLLLLSLRVVYFRLYLRIDIGDGDQRKVQQAIRVQGNFTEYVPLILLMLGLCEIQGLNPVVLHGIGAALVFARLMHALGLSRRAGPSFPRFVGASLTFFLLFAASALCLLRSLAPA